MAKIYTKVEGFTGVRAGVPFVDGVGETDDEYLITWFNNRGYTVILEPKQEAAEASAQPAEEPAAQPAPKKPRRTRKTTKKGE